MKTMLTRAEAAEYLGLKTKTLANWANLGTQDLPFVKVGNVVRYKLADLEKFVADHTVMHTGEAK